MDDIAEAAGVTKPLLYQHFSSKRSLYLELVDSIATDLLTAISKAVAHADGPRQQVELGFAAYFRLVVSARPSSGCSTGETTPTTRNWAEPSAPWRTPSPRPSIR